jgi:hypothetical protein
MSITRKMVMSAAALMTSVSVVLVPAGAAQAVDDLTAVNNCAGGTTANFDSGTFFAGGNNHTRFDPPSQMLNNDAFRITASGTYTTDYWGTRKDVGGDATTADLNWPLPGFNQYMLIAKVDKGSVITSRGRRFNANQWFPVGRDSGCVRYVRTTPISEDNPSAFLIFAYNDPNIGDNGGAGGVRVRQWFCVVC